MPNDVVTPIAFPDYKAHSDEIGSDVPSGHAGVMFASAATGMTLYYEYGRYDPPANIGLVEKRTIPNVAAGTLTVGKLKPVFRKLSQTSGHGGRLRAAWIELPAGSFERMKVFAEARMNLNKNADRPHYDIATNNCCTFARDVAEAGGAEVGLPPGVLATVLMGTAFPHIAELFGSLAITMASPIPRAFLNQLQQAYPGFEFVPPDKWTNEGSGDLVLS